MGSEYSDYPSTQYEGDDVCDTCEGYGEVCVGFGIWSEMRPGLAACPDCGGSGQTRTENGTDSTGVGSRS